jgi:hypothetical protein
VSNLADERAVIAGKLAGAGVEHVVLDPRAVAPFVLVGAPEVLGGVGVGGWSVDYPVHVVAPPPGSADALVWLLDQTELVLRTLGATGATPTRYGEREAPAYELTYRRDIDNPDC